MKSKKIVTLCVILFLVSIQVFAQITLNDELKFMFDPIKNNNQNNSYSKVSKKVNSKEFQKKLIELMDISIEDSAFEYELNKCTFLVIPTVKLDRPNFLDSLYSHIEVKIFYKNKYVGEYRSYSNGIKFNLDDLDKYIKSNRKDIGTFTLDDSGSNERYNGVTFGNIADKLRKSKPEFVFMVEGWYHVYFYYKKGKIYHFDIPRMKIGEFFKKK
jgi:hypothetical protein